MPNREVKPTSADGTAERWESRSPPSFEKPRICSGLFFCIFVPCMKTGLIAIAVTFITTTFNQSVVYSNIYHKVRLEHQLTVIQPDTIPKISSDTLKLPSIFEAKDTATLPLVDTTATISDSVGGVTRSRTNEIIQNRSIIEILSIPLSKRIFSWKFNNHYLDYEQVPIDTSLWLNHLFYPQQKRYESYTFLGNIGSPSISDHFFSRDEESPFLLSRYYHAYADRIQETAQYNVRSPFTTLFYTSAGKRSEMEQLFSVLHTQNVNRHINIGITYDHFGTKGVYQNQLTRNNLISLFGNYHKGNVFGQVSFTNRVYNNEENGGIKFADVVPGDTLETKLIPTWLTNAKTITREQSFSALLGYTLVNIKEVRLASDTIDRYIPLISTKLHLSRESHSRTFTNSASGDYFTNSYITEGKTYDSIALTNWDLKAVLEINQFANIPGMPGLRGWVGYTHSGYHMFKPENYILDTSNESFYSTHIGVAAFSDSPYLSYRGAAKVYFSGDRADDKELRGDVRISLWKDPEMPQLRGRLLISEATPDIFYRTYFSNHYKWDNQFDKEKRFQLGASFEIDKWATEIGYNVVHISNYLYFNSNSLPSQAPDITITSAYAQKNFRFLKGFNFFNRIVWQANTNSDVLSLPDFIAFSALFYEAVLVPGALTGQFGVNLTYRSEFYADAFNPVTGQFYNQRLVRLGNYPTVDVYANFKWKRTILFAKYEHLNQGYPHNKYYSAYSYPINPQIFKFGISWIFYD